MPLIDQATDKCFPEIHHRDSAGRPIAVLVQLFFFMNTSNKLGCTHGNGLDNHQIIKERCPRCRGTKSCLRCPGTYQLVLK